MVSYLLAKPKQMVEAERTTIRIAGIDTNHLTMFAVLLVSQTQQIRTKIDTV